jgi:hypothetical protein
VELEEVVAERVAGRLCELEPSGVALVVRGSYARGIQTPTSDLDISVLVPRMSSTSSAWRTWFEPREGGLPLHVSAGTHTIDEWLASRERAADWALGFPALTEARYLWATPEAREALGDPPSNPHPPAPAELEELVEAVSKLRRAAGARDSVGLRWHAQAAGRVSPGLLRALNPDVVVRDRLEAVRAALELPVAPEHYRADLAVVLGLEPVADETFEVVALRLARELLAFLRERKPDVDPQPGIADALADGTLERHLGFPA